MSALSTLLISSLRPTTKRFIFEDQRLAVTRQFNVIKGPLRAFLLSTTRIYSQAISPSHHLAITQRPPHQFIHWSKFFIVLFCKIANSNHKDHYLDTKFTTTLGSFLSSLVICKYTKHIHLYWSRQNKGCTSVLSIMPLSWLWLTWSFACLVTL